MIDDQKTLPNLKFPLNNADIRQHQPIHQMLIKHSHDQRQISCEIFSFPRIVFKSAISESKRKRHKKKKENLSLLYIYSLAIKV